MQVTRQFSVIYSAFSPISSLLCASVLLFNPFSSPCPALPPLSVILAFAFCVSYYIFISSPCACLLSVGMRSQQRSCPDLCREGFPCVCIGRAQRPPPNSLLRCLHLYCCHTPFFHTGMHHTHTNNDKRWLLYLWRQLFKHFWIHFGILKL